MKETTFRCDVCGIRLTRLNHCYVTTSFVIPNGLNGGENYDLCKTCLSTLREHAKQLPKATE